jgi:hypothetical protein
MITSGIYASYSKIITKSDCSHLYFVETSSVASVYPSLIIFSLSVTYDGTKQNSFMYYGFERTVYHGVPQMVVFGYFALANASIVSGSVYSNPKFYFILLYIVVICLLYARVVIS